MRQDRLNHVREIDLTELIDKFAKIKARKMPLPSSPFNSNVTLSPGACTVSVLAVHDDMHNAYNTVNENYVYFKYHFYRFIPWTNILVPGFTLITDCDCT